MALSLLLFLPSCVTVRIVSPEPPTWSDGGATVGVEVKPSPIPIPDPTSRDDNLLQRQQR